MRIFLFIILLLQLNPAKTQVDSLLVKQHLNYIVNECPSRNFANLTSLDKCADYIYSVFDKYGDSTVFQEYDFKNVTYKNVITSFGPRDGERIIIGAHYDVCGDQDGADDNASGTVGLLELARLLHKADLDTRIDLVAYTLEEPPFFRTEHMGSSVHAQYIIDNNIPVNGMICLEMIGYFSDEKKSQGYPLGILKMFYGGKGNYITLVKKTAGGKFARKFNRKFKRNNSVRTKSFTAPASLQGIDFSDHLNYWGRDIPAVMITNTGFFRNHNYHEKSDKIETLDIQRMCSVIQQTFNSVIKIASK